MKVRQLLLFLIITVLVVIGMTPVAIAATPEQIGASTELGVDYLVAAQRADGGWGPYSSDQLGTTGLVLVKLEERAFELGYDGPFDPLYPYKENVEKGLDYYFLSASTVAISNQPAGNPDTDGDGQGIYVGNRVYDTGILMMAIAAGRDPTRTVATGPLSGRTYGDVLQDMADWMSYAQTDTGNLRGGWSYNAQNNGGSADGSNAGYAILGLLYAEEPLYGYACDIPPFVETNLNNYIDYVQSDWVPAGVNPSYDGGAGYTGPDYWVNSLKTGNLLTQMAFVGDDSSDVRVQEALNYIGRHWNENWVQGWGKTGSVEYQSVYCLMKGFEAMDISLNGVPGVADWYDDMANELLAEQSLGGSWPSSPAYVWPDGSIGHWVSPELSTVWALLTLERFAPPPPVADFDVIKSVSDTMIHSGDSVTYTFEVVNTKDIPIDDIVLTDDKLGIIDGPDSGDSDNDGVLDEGETWIYTKTTNLFVTTTNKATLTGNDPLGASLDATSNSVTVTVEINGVPEFPSFALPIGMIVGISFVVYTLRTTRKD